MMQESLRVLLIISAVLTLAYFLQKIRKNRLQIEYAIFWSLFSAGLLLLAAFPELVGWAANLVGIESPANLVYLSVIFVLMLRLFSITAKLSKMDTQITRLTQHIAIMEKNQNETERTE